MQIDEPSPPMGLRERKKRDARRTIRSAALRLFAVHGFDQVSVDQIAAEADVSRSTFFNYFPTKEAVVVSPDPAALVLQQQLCAGRPASELLWQSLTEVIIGTLEDDPDPLVEWRRLITASPQLTATVHTMSAALIAELGEWAARRAGPGREQMAELQIATAIAAVTTAFRQWQDTEDPEAMVALARTYFAQLAPAFPAEGRDRHDA